MSTLPPPHGEPSDDSRSPTPAGSAAQEGPHLDEPLTDLAELAHRTLPGTDGAGVTIIRDGNPVYRSSNTFSETVDQLQYSLNEGPCLDAVNFGSTVVTGSVQDDRRRWPRFTAKVAAIQLSSVLSVPLRVNDGVIGSVNLYAHAPNAFTADRIVAAESFARPAAHALSTARVITGTLDLTTILQNSLQDRAIVETAIGILIGRHHLSVEAARDRLRDEAGASREDLLTAAARIVADSQRRPRS